MPALWWCFTRGIMQANKNCVSNNSLGKQKKQKKAWGKNCYFTVQSALLFPTDCLSKVTDPWANVTSQSIGCHALGPNIVFLSTQLVAFFRDCLSQKTYQLTWGNQSWGDTIPDQSAVCESVVCDSCKTPAVIAKPLNVLVLELFFIVGLFCLLGSDYVYPSHSFIPNIPPTPASSLPPSHLRLSIQTLDSIDVRSAGAVFGNANK